ncbi:MAG: phenylalanine--tRNA ligase subunit alpha [Cryomorphaceae bacterium]|jgi:phenylalanyl-tRNA synthetase alpha chain|nr:phenylalanine--tRNA ligase subunit alpha [Cryomorphaceae bacterium]
MKKEIEQIRAEANSWNFSDAVALEQFRIRFMGSKGVLKELYADLKNVPTEEKRETGQAINTLRSEIEELFELNAQNLSTSNTKTEKLDLSRPAARNPIGYRHPLSLVRSEIIQIFSRIGYAVSEGPEIEDDWHNFSALNFPPEHPARDMQDTFFIEKGEKEMALRTHTSSVQVRVMETSTPPIRTISPGRVYRNEAISARAHCFFHQVEGLYVDKDVSFADLKQTLLYFAKELFGEKATIRMRPSYFPFTEPSAEVDVSCTLCSAQGCNVCKHSGWLEILGCGMVDPNVLDACGIDSNVYSGFAFGMGIERIAQLKYRVNDLRLYSENDLRFLKQFTGGM